MPYLSLGNTILKMGVGSVEGDLLPSLLEVHHKCLVGKVTIVSIVVLNLYAVPQSKDSKFRFALSIFSDVAE